MKSVLIGFLVLLAACLPMDINPVSPISRNGKPVSTLCGKVECPQVECAEVKQFPDGIHLMGDEIFEIKDTCAEVFDDIVLKDKSRLVITHSKVTFETGTKDAPWVVQQDNSSLEILHSHLTGYDPQFFSRGNARLLIENSNVNGEFNFSDESSATLKDSTVSTLSPSGRAKVLAADVRFSNFILNTKEGEYLTVTSDTFSPPDYDNFGWNYDRESRGGSVFECVNCTHPWLHLGATTTAGSNVKTHLRLEDLQQVSFSIALTAVDSDPSAADSVPGIEEYRVVLDSLPEPSKTANGEVDIGNIRVSFKNTHLMENWAWSLGVSGRNLIVDVLRSTVGETNVDDGATVNFDRVNFHAFFGSAANGGRISMKDSVLMAKPFEGTDDGDYALVANLGGEISVLRSVFQPQGIRVSAHGGQLIINESENQIPGPVTATNFGTVKINNSGSSCRDVSVLEDGSRVVIDGNECSNRK